MLISVEVAFESAGGAGDCAVGANRNGAEEAGETAGIVEERVRGDCSRRNGGLSCGRRKGREGSRRN